jgi:hypothetical protein
MSKVSLTPSNPIDAKEINEDFGMWRYRRHGQVPMRDDF